MFTTQLPLVNIILSFHCNQSVTVISFQRARKLAYHRNQGAKLYQFVKWRVEILFFIIYFSTDDDCVLDCQLLVYVW